LPQQSGAAAPSRATLELFCGPLDRSRNMSRGINNLGIAVEFIARCLSNADE
jgi:hypothetical protein